MNDRWPISFPESLLDFAKTDGVASRAIPDVDAMIFKAAIFGDSSPEPGSFAGRLGVYDARELDLDQMVAALIDAKQKATSPSTMTRPRTEAAPAQPTSPAPASCWDWSETFPTPRRNAESPSNRFRLADSGDIAKRATDRAQEIVAKAQEYEATGEKTNCEGLSDDELLKLIQSGPVHGAFACEYVRRQKTEE